MNVTIAFSCDTPSPHFHKRNPCPAETGSTRNENGERRLPACVDGHLARRTIIGKVAPGCGVSAMSLSTNDHVFGRMPKTAGWKPALPKSDFANFRVRTGLVNGGTLLQAGRRLRLCGGRGARATIEGDKGPRSSVKTKPRRPRFGQGRGRGGPISPASRGI